MKEIASESPHNSQIMVNDPCWYRALSLTERLASLQMQPSTENAQKMFNSELATRKIKQWQKQEAFSKGVSFTERLSVDHLTEEELLTLLGEPAEAVQQRTPVPEWLTLLTEVFAGPDAPVISAEDPQKLANLSLLNIVDIFIVYAVKCLNTSVAALSDEYDYLPFDVNTATSIFLPNLAGSLQFVINRTMVLELNVARLQDLLQGETPEERFKSFILLKRQKNELKILLEEYPVLARQLINVSNRWLNYSMEFLRHLCADWSQICATFTPQRDPGMLIEVQGGVGDVHRGGRSVLKLKFNSDMRLIYKPKSLAIDLHFQELLVWLNAQGYEPAFRTIKLLDRDTYGWSEFVEAPSCGAEAEVARFYERQGGYLALLYALDATDFHYENLIAAGEHPILIDLEALFHPRAHGVIQPDVAFDVVQFSVTRVGLLPMRLFSTSAGKGLDLSGLGGHEGQQTPHPVMNWEGAGTDQMRLMRQYQTMPGQSNRPRLDGVDIELLEYRHCIVTGFNRMYQLLMSRREQFIAEPLSRFVNDEIRCIVRPTQFYGHLFAESFHPDLMRDALSRDRHFDHLWLALIVQPNLMSLVPAERNDLLTGDIPMFTSRPGTRDIYSSQGECSANFLAQSSLDVAKQTILNLDDDDLERQRWFIEASFAAMLMGKGQLWWKRPTITKPTGKEVTYERLLAAACAIGDRLCKLAVGDERGINWVGLTLVQEREWLLSSTSPDLYNGNTGIMFFLSYLGHITGETKYTDMAVAAYTTMYKQMEQFKDHLQAIGAFDGLGAVIYLLSHLGLLWNDPTLFAEAHEIAKRLPDMIEKDIALDVLSGSAGCILSLISLYKVSPSPEIIAMAVKCGERLVEKARPVGDGSAWDSLMSSAPLTGFSHGAAGCALSLFALAELSGEARFQQLALRALAYERSVFSANEQNWPDYREIEGTEEIRDATLSSDGNSYQNTWCHGAPGIGLSRLAALRYIDDAQIRKEIDIALQTTISSSFGLNHSLCHGDLGNLETLLVAKQVLEEPQYTEQCDYFSRLILDSIEADGWLTGVPLGVETPGLMTGLAGIGYGLLRLAEPERIPSVLLVAPPTIKE